MTAPLRSALLLSVFVSAIGCSQVIVPEPVGSSTPEPLREALEGSWLVDDEAIYIAFNEEGHGEIAWIEREEDQFQLSRGKIAAITRDDRYFMSLQEEDGEGEENAHLWVEYEPRDSGSLVIWSVDVDRFEKAVTEGELKGKAERGRHTVTVTLDSKAEQVLQFLLDHDDAIEFRKPIFLERLN